MCKKIRLFAPHFSCVLFHCDHRGAHCMPANLAAYQCQRKDVTYFNKSYTQQTAAGERCSPLPRHLRQHRTIPALRLKHRSGSCGTASALPKCSIISGCGTHIVLRFAVSATGGAHLCSIQYYLRFWLGICRTSLAVSVLRIMRYCLYFSLSCSSSPARGVI